MSIGADFDAVLVAAQTGGEWAVAVLYRDVNPRLLRYLRAKAPDVAEDLASEVWLAAARHLPTFEGDEAAFRGWMFTMARRQAMGHWRKQGRRRTHPVPVDTLAERAGPDDPEAAGLAALAAHPPRHGHRRTCRDRSSRQQPVCSVLGVHAPAHRTHCTDPRRATASHA